MSTHKRQLFGTVWHNLIIQQVQSFLKLSLVVTQSASRKDRAVPPWQRASSLPASRGFQPGDEAFEKRLRSPSLKGLETRRQDAALTGKLETRRHILGGTVEMRPDRAWRFSRA